MVTIDFHWIILASKLPYVFFLINSGTSNELTNFSACEYRTTIAIKEAITNTIFPSVISLNISLLYFERLYINTNNAIAAPKYCPS